MASFGGMTTDTTLTPWSGKNVKEYFEARYLKDLRGKAILGEDALEKDIPGNLSKTIEFTQVRSNGPITTAALEGEDPSSQTKPLTYLVTATLAEYAAYCTLSSLLTQASLEKGEQFVDAYKNTMMQTREWILMKTLCTGAGSTIYGQSTATLAAMTYAKTPVANDLYRMRTILRKNNAQVFSDGLFRVVLNPRTIQSLYTQTSSPVIATYQGESGKDVREFQAWKFAGLMLKENTLKGYYVDLAGATGTETAGAVASGRYNLLVCPFYGKDSFAAIKLAAKGTSLSSGVNYNEPIIRDGKMNSYTAAFTSLGFRFPMAAAVLDTRAVFNYICADGDFATS